MMLRIALCMLGLLRPVFAQGSGSHSPMIEIEFQSLGPHGGPGQEELRSMLAGGSPPSEIDDLGAIFSQLLAPPVQRPSRRQRPGGLRSPLLGAGAFSMDPVGFAGLPPDHVGSLTIQRSSRVPLSTFHDLFPMPTMVLPDDEDDSSEDDDFFGHDALVANMMQHLSNSFKQDMLPAIHRKVSGTQSQNACADEMKMLCNGTHSRLQCLGQHVEKTSAECRKDVGKSVPFLCSSSIDKLCNVLERGILPCLADHLPELDESCRDAVVATHSVIAKVNTQKASIRDPETGHEKVHVPIAAPAEALDTDASKAPDLVPGEAAPQKQQEVKPKSAPLMTITDASPQALQQVSFDQKFTLRNAAGASGQSSGMTTFDMAAIVMAFLVVGFFMKTSFIDRKGKPTGGSLLELGDSDSKHML
mmetsp:Transcript_65522/g.165951  ORF Transcript_65522/g.165951 Transcript_65522/m.165951 type:complete len:416 (+) Transcript_65522:71-1318(+)